MSYSGWGKLSKLIEGILSNTSSRMLQYVMDNEDWVGWFCMRRIM